MRQIRIINASSLIFSLIFLILIAKGQEQRPEIVIQRGHYNPIRSAVFSPSGELLATGDSGSTIKIWNVESGRLIRSFDWRAGAEILVEFSNNGDFIAGSDWKSGEERVWNLKSGKEIDIQNEDFDYSSLFKGESSQLDKGKVVSSLKKDKYARVDENKVSVWDTKSRKLLHRFPAEELESEPVTLSSDGKYLAFVNHDILPITEEIKNPLKLNSIILIWDLNTNNIKQLAGKYGELSLREISDDNQHIIGVESKVVNSTTSYTLRIWNLQSRQLEKSYQETLFIGFLTNDEILTCGNGENFSASILNFKTGFRKILGGFPCKTNNFTANNTLINTSPEKTRIAMCKKESDRDTIKIYDLKSGNEKTMDSTDIPLSCEKMLGLQFSKNGNVLVYLDKGAELD